MAEADIIKRLERIEKLLIEQTILKKKILSVEEAALFMKYKKSQVYKLSSSNSIPHYKPRGKEIFFEREELEKFLMQNPVRSAKEINLDATTHVVLNNSGSRTKSKSK